MRCHPYVLKEMQALGLADEKKALTQFDQAIWGHVGFALSNFVRSLWFGFTGGYLMIPPERGELALLPIMYSI